MTDKIELTNVDDVINAFGGTVKFAKAFGYSKSRVSNYKAKKRFASGEQMRIYCRCLEIGLKVDLSVFCSES